MNNNLTTIRLAGGAQGFNWLPVFIAEERSMFEDQGINIEYLKLGSVEKATQAVLDGEADVAITPPEGAVNNFVGNGPLRIIGSNSERLPMSLVAAPGIKDVAQLRGKRLGTSSLKEGTAIYTRVLLEQKAGLQYPEDYEFVLAGIHQTRWTALQNDEIDAAPQPAPWNFLAERDGYNLLGDIAEVIPEIVFAALVARQDWIVGNSETAGRFLSALIQAHDFVNDPAHDESTIPVYQQITTPDEPELARRGFQYTRDLGMWPRGLEVSPEAFNTTLEVMQQSELLTARQASAAGDVIVHIAAEARKA